MNDMVLMEQRSDIRMSMDQDKIDGANNNKFHHKYDSRNGRSIDPC